MAVQKFWRRVGQRAASGSPRKTLSSETKSNQIDSANGASRSARAIKFDVIRKRQDFLAMRGADKAHSPSFLMLVRPIGDGPARLGLTVTKKLGGAVIRNRIRRRLRAAAREIFPNYAEAGADYVLVARRAAYDRNYDALLDDMKRSLLRLSRNTT